jgi:hypothetical protein
MNVVAFVRDPIFAAIEAHKAAQEKANSAMAEVRHAHQLADQMTFIGPKNGQAARRAFVESIIGDDEDDFTEPSFEEASDVFDVLIATVPTTVPGLLAMLDYAGQLSAHDRYGINEDAAEFISSVATAARALAKKASGIGQ